MLNNTYRSHEFVNILSKIEADKGIVFNYADNEKLKKSGFAVEGKTVNGFVDTNTGAVTLNVQSAKSWQSVVGHEITHVLEGTDAYEPLQKALFAYAESKGELTSRRGEVTELYKGMNADIDSELTAELIGDYLFTDKDFVTHLTSDRNLFQKIYDEIKYLYKVATGKEQKEIAKVKKEFDKAWKELNVKPSESEQKNNTAENGGVKYSIGKNSKTKDIFGFIIDENAIVDEDLLEEISTYHPEAEVDINGNITVYHRTTEEAAKKIKQTGIMKSKEDALFFSSKESGYATDYGKSVVKLKIPSTMLRLNDVFDGEVHFDLPLKYKKDGYSLDVSKYLFEDYSLGESNNRMRITENLTDTQRTEILKTKNIVAPVCEGEADHLIEKESDLKNEKLGLIKSAIVRIADEFEVFTDYDISDVKLKISLSKTNLKEAVNKEITPVQLAKLMPVLKETVENAIGIEKHTNRYYYDNTTVSFENLFGGYIDGEYFVPVRFGLKHIKGGETVLYVVVDQQKIKAEVLKTITQKSIGSTASRSAYVYNLSQVTTFVNSKDILRYLPDDMLSDSQKKKKWEGIAETIKYTNEKNDAKYKVFIAKENIQAAKVMVNAAAEVAFKDSKIRDKGGKLVKVYHGTEAEDFYEFDKARRGQTDSSMYGRGYYFTFDPDYSSDFGDNIREFYLDIKNPFYIDINAPAKVIADFLISKGVEVDFDYRNMICHFFAKNFGSQKFTDTLVSLGYDGVIARTDEGEYFEAVAFHRNQMKLADAVTYDNDGNVIPISERFNSDEVDIRYSVSDKSDDIAPEGDFNTPLNELYYDDFAPIRSDIVPAKVATDTNVGGKNTSSDNDDIAPADGIAPAVVNNTITDAPIRDDVA